MRNAVGDHLVREVSMVRGWAARVSREFPRRFGWPNYPRFSEQATVRLLIGPGNYAGQAASWARAVVAAGSPRIDAKSMRVGDQKFSFSADVLESRDYLRSGVGKWRQRRWIMGSATHVLVEACLPVLSTNGSAPAEWERLRRAGLSVALVAHGSDIRVPSLHAERYPDSPFRSVPLEWQQWVSHRERVTRSNMAAMIESGLPLFVSTPDLLDYLPQAHLVPAVVDSFAALNLGVSRYQRPRVLFTPTNGWLKGAPTVAPVLAELHDKGVIEHVNSAHHPATSFHELMASTDIVIDAIGLGAYGVTSVEAMGMGKIAMVHIAEHVLPRYPQPPPVVLVPDSTSFRSTLMEVVERIDDFRTSARDGLDYVTRWHDGRVSAGVLARNWLDFPQ